MPGPGGSRAEIADGMDITEEEVAPVSPQVDPAEKKIIVNITYQTFSCFEGNREVYFCRASTGLLAAQIIGSGDAKLQAALAQFKVKLAEESRAKNKTLAATT